MCMHACKSLAMNTQVCIFLDAVLWVIMEKAPLRGQHGGMYDLCSHSVRASVLSSEYVHACMCVHAHVCSRVHACVCVRMCMRACKRP